MKKVTVLLLASFISLTTNLFAADTNKKVEVKVFAAASLKGVMSTFEARYEKIHPNVDVILNTDSSGKLMNQIKEGAPCDIFFSAATKQMDELEKTNQFSIFKLLNISFYLNFFFPKSSCYIKIIKFTI